MFGYYNGIKYNEHVFVFSVGGRTGSTALQRILNSSGEICIWGEPWGAVQSILTFYYQFKEHSDKVRNKKNPDELPFFIQSFETNKHDKFYPNAFRHDENLLNHLKEMLSQMLAPLSDKIARFGFKDIGGSGIKQFEGLVELYPGSRFIFLYRNPILQWNSVKTSGFFPYSNDVHHFIKMYCRNTGHYLDFFNEYTNRCILVENTSLMEEPELNKILDFIHITKIDRDLLNKKVSSYSSKAMTENEEEIVKKSEAYSSYQELQMKRFSTESGGQHNTQATNHSSQTNQSSTPPHL